MHLYPTTTLTQVSEIRSDEVSGAIKGAAFVTVLSDTSKAAEGYKRYKHPGNEQLANILSMQSY
jgi:hypothetical protein